MTLMSVAKRRGKMKTDIILKKLNELEECMCFILWLSDDKKIDEATEEAKIILKNLMRELEEK